MYNTFVLKWVIILDFQKHYIEIFIILLLNRTHYVYSIYWYYLTSTQWSPVNYIC